MNIEPSKPVADGYRIHLSNKRRNLTKAEVRELLTSTLLIPLQVPNARSSDVQELNIHVLLCNTRRSMYYDTSITDLSQNKI